MAGQLNTAFRNAILDMMVGLTPATDYGLADITNLRIALVTATPTAADTTMADVTECSGTDYVRVDPSSDFGTAAAAGAIANDGQIAFAEDTVGDYGTLRGWVLVNGTTAGTTTDKILGFNAVSAQTVQAGDTPAIDSATADITLS